MKSVYVSENDAGRTQMFQLQAIKSGHIDNKPGNILLVSCNGTAIDSGIFQDNSENTAGTDSEFSQ